MTKLATADLKKMISVWLDTPEIRSSHFTEAETAQSVVDREASHFGLGPGMTMAAFQDHVFGLFKDGSQWSRVEKRRAGEDVFEWFRPSGRALYFRPDHVEMHGFEVSRAEEVYLAGGLTKCWLRTFVPKSSLSDSFRLEVVTDPDDQHVVAWQVITD